MTPSKPIHYPIKPLLVGGLMFALIGILLDISGSGPLFRMPLSFAQAPVRGKAAESLEKSCATDIVKSARLSRAQLLELLSIPERDSKTKVREIVKEPYCQLSSLNIRADVKAEREAYPLEFDPNTALVILYENDEYAGYRFKF